MGFINFPQQVLGSTQWGAAASSGASLTMDAAGESCAAIGHLCLPAGSGSKTISAAGGGCLYFRASTGNTFSNGGSNLRIGIQDVSNTTGLEDATFDVYADLVGGTDTIANSTFYKIPMESGTKTIAHGDLIALAIELTTRGGADAVVVARESLPWLVTGTGGALPYASADNGANAKVSNIPWMFIKFDDGTVGWLQGSPAIYMTGISSVAFNSGSTPDEHGPVFTAPVGMKVNGIGFGLGTISAGANFEAILYGDPLGTPVALATVTVDIDQVFSSAASNWFMVPITETTLVAGSAYAIMLRPTTTNNVTYYYQDLGANNEDIKAGQFFGSSLIVGTRTNQTGAFSSLGARYVPTILLGVSAFIDAAGGGGAPIIGGSIVRPSL